MQFKELTQEQKDIIKKTYNDCDTRHEAQEKLANSIPVESLTAESTNTSDKYQGYIDTVVEEVKEKYNVNAYVTPLLIYTNMDKAKQDRG